MRRCDELGLVEIVGDLAVDEIGELAAVGEIVDDDDVGVAAAIQLANEVAADESGAAGDDDHGSAEPATEPSASTKRYVVLQYGHVASPVTSIGKYTFGCEFHRYMLGSGQCSGRSARVDFVRALGVRPLSNSPRLCRDVHALLALPRLDEAGDYTRGAVFAFDVGEYLVPNRR